MTDSAPASNLQDIREQAVAVLEGVAHCCGRTDAYRDWCETFGCVTVEPLAEHTLALLAEVERLRKELSTLLRAVETENFNRTGRDTSTNLRAAIRRAERASASSHKSGGT